MKDEEAMKEEKEGKNKERVLNLEENKGGNCGSKLLRLLG